MKIECYSPNKATKMVELKVDRGLLKKELMMTSQLRTPDGKYIFDVAYDSTMKSFTLRPIFHFNGEDVPGKWSEKKELTEPYEPIGNFSAVNYGFMVALEWTHNQKPEYFIIYKRKKGEKVWNVLKKQFIPTVLKNKKTKDHVAGLRLGKPNVYTYIDVIKDTEKIHEYSVYAAKTVNGKPVFSPYEVATSKQEQKKK